ncbi:MAG: polysaccharide deacetylase family protein, partial [bacterium]
LLTFDDGTDDLYHHRSLFLERRLPGVVFVPAAFVGRPNLWEWPLPTRRVRHLGGCQLRELIAAGWEVGLHGDRHRDLTRLSDHDLHRELHTARLNLADRLGQAINLVSYPYGRVDARVLAVATRAGFAAGFVVCAPWPGAGLLTVPRRPVYCIDSPHSVVVKLSDPENCTARGKWEVWKERLAHGVGHWSAGWRRERVVDLR